MAIRIYLSGIQIKCVADYELYTAQLLHQTELEASRSAARARLFGKLLIYITLTLERNIYYREDLICAYPLEDLRPTSCADRAHTPKLQQFGFVSECARGTLLLAHQHFLP